MSQQNTVQFHYLKSCFAIYNSCLKYKGIISYFPFGQVSVDDEVQTTILFFRDTFVHETKQLQFVTKMMQHVVLKDLQDTSFYGPCPLYFAFCQSKYNSKTFLEELLTITRCSILACCYTFLSNINNFKLIFNPTVVCS
jgi:hypothetical protein